MTMVETYPSDFNFLTGLNERITAFASLTGLKYNDSGS
jgi:hypothetical protein